MFVGRNIGPNESMVDFNTNVQIIQSICVSVGGVHGKS